MTQSVSKASSTKRYFLSGNSSVCRRTVTKATPSYSKHHGVVVNNVPIQQLSLHATSTEAVEIGSGRFGACTLMVYKGMFEVCVKQVSEEFSAQAVKSEAAVMIALNSCAFTLHCFGVFSHSIAMAL